MEASELVSLRREPLFGLLEKEPKAALELLRLCGERLRWTSGLLEDAALLDAPARLAKRLLSLSELHGEVVDGGRKVRISQEELANFLGHRHGMRRRRSQARDRAAVATRPCRGRRLRRGCARPS
jgi:CRP-like cAMP-binding protein